MPGFNWEANPEYTARLTEMWNDGATASVIAKALGNGLTRCSIIGKAHRLGLASHANTKTSKLPPLPQKPKIAVVKTPSPPALEKPLPVLPPETIGNDRQCKHIEGHPSEKGWVMCGNPVKDDKAYCPYHHSKVIDLVRTAQIRARQH